MEVGSLKKRYVFKLSSNLLGFGINLVTAGIVPRALGPRAYGDFSFLTNFFNYFLNFFDMGTSICFFTKLSQRQKDFELVIFYTLFVIIVSLITIVTIVICGNSSLHYLLWPDQFVFYIYLGAIWGILSWYFKILSSMMDAYGITITSEKYNIVQKIAGIGVLVILYYNYSLNLTNYFFYNFFLFGILIIAFIYLIFKNVDHKVITWRIRLEKIKLLTHEFYKYSSPLFIYTTIIFFANIYDRWVLQIWGGSVQQAYFGLSYQIGAICFLFTSSMIPLLTREFSISHAEKDINKMAEIFKVYMPFFYSVAAYFACFIIIESDKIVYIIGGAEYQNAQIVIAVFVFSTIHQTYDAINTSLFFATERTKLFTKIGIIFMLAGVPITYIMVAPHSMFGLNAGALGLTIKVLIFQILYVNVHLYFNVKMLNISIARFIYHQVIPVAIFIMVAFIVRYLSDSLLGINNEIISFIIEGILYTMLIIGIALNFPVSIGMSKTGKDALWIELKNNFKYKFHK